MASGEIAQLMGFITVPAYKQESAVSLTPFHEIPAEFGIADASSLIFFEN